MMDDKKWAEFDQLVKGEIYTQVEDAAEEAMLDGVKLALFILQGIPTGKLRLRALRYLYRYGEWDKMKGLKFEDFDQLMQWNYGDDYIPGEGRKYFE